jgi:hypothetical protein
MAAFCGSWLGMIAPSTILRAVLSLAAVTLWACSLGMPMVVWRNDWVLMTAGLLALLWFNRELALA